MPEGAERTVAVTGAASGIGAACADLLGAGGWHVICIDIVPEGCDIVADLSTAEGRQSAVDQTTARCGGSLAGVVTCAGLAGSPHRPGSVVASLNYFGTVAILRGLCSLLPPGGAAVAISSNSTTVQPEIPSALVDACLADDEDLARRLADDYGSLLAYPASKLAVAHWVRREATATGWAGSGLRLNAIAPGMIDTPMVAEMRGDPETAPMLDLLPIPLGRPGRAEEIAEVVAFLLGPSGSFFCGSVLFCDGGSDALLRTRDWPAAWDISVRQLGRQLS